MIKANVICFGDSITQCAGATETGRWTARLAFLLEEHFPDRFHVYNKGVGGNTTAIALDRIQLDVLPLLPGIVLIEFGINDSYVYPWCQLSRVGLGDFVHNLKQIVRLIRSKGGSPCLIVNHPVTVSANLHSQGNGKPLGANLLPYNQAIRNTAKRNPTPCIDLPRILKKKRINPNRLWSEDEVHLSPCGNRIYSDCMFDAFSSLISSNTT